MFNFPKTFEHKPQVNQKKEAYKCKTELCTTVFMFS